MYIFCSRYPYQKEKNQETVKVLITDKIIVKQIPHQIYVSSYSKAKKTDRIERLLN